MTISTARGARIARGAALLDEKSPGWFNRVDLDTLSQSNGIRCVLAQVYGTYVSGKNVLNLSDAEAAAHGFDAGSSLGDPMSAYNLDTVEWKCVITERRQRLENYERAFPRDDHEPELVAPANQRGFTEAEVLTLARLIENEIKIVEEDMVRLKNDAAKTAVSGVKLSLEDLLGKIVGA